MGNNGPACCGESVSVRERTGLPEIPRIHQYISYFTEGKLLNRSRFLLKAEPVEKGIVGSTLIYLGVATSADLLILGELLNPPHL